MRTYTELRFYPNNENKIARMHTIQGDHNIISPVMGCYFKNLDRKKESYCFEIKEENGEIRYKYNLKNSEFESYKKHINDFK